MLEKMKYGFYSLLVLLNTAAVAFAQNSEHKVDVDVDLKGGQQWYNQWWIWAVVAMLFILLIVAMLSRGRSEAR